MDFNQENAELLAFFFAEMDEQLETLEQEILKLEQNAEDEEGIQSIFRVAHSIKGSSAAMGLTKIKDLAHEMENVLDQIRKRNISVTSAVVNTLFQCIDVLQELKEAYSSESDVQTDITSIIEQLIACKQQTETPKPAETTTTSPSAALQPDELKLIADLKEKGHHLFHCIITLDPECQMEVVRTQIIFNQLTQVSAFSIPNFQPKNDQPLVKSIFIVTLESKEELQELIGDMVDVIKVEIEAISFAHPTEKKPEKTKEVKEKRNNQTIRVDVERLESIMNLVGEIIIDQTRITQLGSLLKSHSGEDAIDELEETVNHMSKVIGELQENVMKTRMLPIEQLFNRFPRIIRDASQKLNKDINLVMEGGETELDRNVIEEINDPLIHIIRNSIDHGLETAEKRKEIGKPEKGLVKMSAKHEDNQVVVIVEDDGNGIDAEKIKESAIKKGILTEEKAETLSDVEAVQLIFKPGFSTASQVSDISGRGVGMDIVRSHIEKLSGTIEIETKKGVGTKMIIKLPLTLAIMKGLLIELNKRVYSLPTNSIIEIVRIQEEDIQFVGGKEFIQIRERILPLCWLHDHFHFPRAHIKNKNIVVVIIGVGDKQMGLVVDELIGNQEIVIKSLGNYIGKIDGISGAAILGNGGIALILDTIGIMNLLRHEKEGEHES